MSIAPLTFTGVSQYSSDFQSILTRAVQISQIPVTALQNHQSDLLQEKTLLSGISTAVGNLASSLQSLGTSASTKALGATSSDPNTVAVSNTGSTSATSYVINSITSTATAASERSNISYADSIATPVSTTGQLNLVVGSTTYPINLTTNNLISLRDQINALGSGVSASILTTSSGNYLSLAANSTGQTTLKLVDDPTGANTNLLTNTNQGTNAVFQLNGINVQQAGNVVNSVIPGVTFTLLKPSTAPVTLSLASDSSQLASGLSDFVTNYNALKAQLQAQVGASAGLLSGDTAITQLQQSLRQLAGYTSKTGSIQSLADLGVTFDATGKASFDQTTLDSLSGAQITDGFSFIGSSTTGLGGYSLSFSEYSDPITGLIKVEQDGIDRSDTHIQTQITTQTDRINAMQTALLQQLTKADAMQANLQSQQQTLTASLQGLNLVLFGKSTSQT